MNRLRSFLRIVFPWQDARRYLVVREEIVDRFLLGATIRSPEHLDERVDLHLSGEDVQGYRQAEEMRFVVIAREPKFEPLPGPQPLFSKDGDQ